ncbi:MAG: 1-deoxy-D-xylulose-5-phosphate synthase [Victivallales bacterium]|nr:1-deoxy-D-xylulose-5-phosphate synthase [Victivallales bacterium]
MSFSLAQITPETRLDDLSLADLRSLADDLRSTILNTVARQGGHLASNLGTVELELALHTVFDFRRDRLFFDTGHQCYTHKLLSGRAAAFVHLREHDGCSGFPLRSESPQDAFGTGHSGTAISAALGCAAAFDRIGSDARVVALVGDGALGCGSSLEGLNNLAVTTKRFLLVLNDNKMSIARNVGAISRLLNNIISARSYNAIRNFSRTLVRGIPFVGEHLKGAISRMEQSLKSLFLHGQMFSELGLRYIGPVDGHSLEDLITILKRLKQMQGPLLLHVYTTKGKGYPPAEQHPDCFHGVSPFEVSTGKPVKASPSVTFSSAFGKKLLALREADDRIVAITAGMVGGTGLSAFARKYPNSFFDTGIAEGHATAFAAGLAANGFHPVFAVYASFVQRAFDYVFHDACLQSLPVLFCLDRSGMGVDGPTHHGILDFAFWQALPNLAVLQPADADELATMMEAALARRHPVVIRYPAGDASPLLPAHQLLQWGRAEVVRTGHAPLAIWAVGRELATALEVANILGAQGVAATVVNTRFTLPFDRELMERQARAGAQIAVIEDHVVAGGFGSFAAAETGLPILRFGWPRQLPGWGDVNHHRRLAGLMPDDIAKSLLEHLNGKEACL